MQLTQSVGKCMRTRPIGFGCTCDWMKKWRESFKPIVWRRKCKTNFFSTLKRKPLYDLDRTNHQAITSTEQTQTGLTNNTCACMKIIEKLTVDIVHQVLLLSYKWLIHDLDKPNNIWHLIHLKTDLSWPQQPNICTYCNSSSSVENTGLLEYYNTRFWLNRDHWNLTDYRNCTSHIHGTSAKVSIESDNIIIIV